MSMDKEKSWDMLLQQLDEMEEKARISGGLEKQEKERRKGKMTARDRVEALLDAGTFVEINMFVETQTFDFDMQKKKILLDDHVVDLLLDSAAMGAYSSFHRTLRSLEGPVAALTARRSIIF